MEFCQEWFLPTTEVKQLTTNWPRNAGWRGYQAYCNLETLLALLCLEDQIESKEWFILVWGGKWRQRLFCNLLLSCIRSVRQDVDKVNATYKASNNHGDWWSLQGFGNRRVHIGLACLFLLHHMYTSFIYPSSLQYAPSSSSYRVQTPLAHPVHTRAARGCGLDQTYHLHCDPQMHPNPNQNITASLNKLRD